LIVIATPTPPPGFALPRAEIARVIGEHAIITVVIGILRFSALFATRLAKGGAELRAAAEILGRG